RVLDPIRSQVFLGGGKHGGAVAQRSHQRRCGLPYGRVVVDDGYHAKLCQFCSPHPRDLARTARKTPLYVCESCVSVRGTELYSCIGGHGASRRRPSASAMRTSSASDLAPIFRITLPRWTLTVISLTPISPAICLFSKPAVTSPMTSCSRAVRDWKPALTLEMSPALLRRLRSRSSPACTASNMS